MADKLLLIPTELERNALQKRLPGLSEVPGIAIELCGFGVIAAAANTARLLQHHRPGEILLVGIAGAYDDSLAIGSAHCFDQVICHGVGAGQGDSFLSAEQMGWQHHHNPPIGDRLKLHSSARVSETKTLVTVCAASDSPAMAQQRAAKVADAAEDMETFAVALACRIEDVPLRVIRGISNKAGVRNQAQWRIHEALDAVAKRLANEFETGPFNNH